MVSALPACMAESVLAVQTLKEMVMKQQLTAVAQTVQAAAMAMLVVLVETVPVTLATIVHAFLVLMV